MVYALALNLRQDVEFGRGAPAYYVLVFPHRDLRRLATVNVGGEARYEFDAQDGNAPQRLTLTFPPTVSAETVRRAYAALCTGKPEEDPRPGALRCSAGAWDMAIEPPSAPGTAAPIVVLEER